jgi:hypothetical protein
VAHKKGKLEKFVCRCGKLKIWTDDTYTLYVKVSGTFMLEACGQLGLIQPVCNVCRAPAKG